MTQSHELERLFLDILDAGSLKAAAARHDTHPSTVSRRISSLEQRLGVQLLRRSTRATTPTDAGQRYAEVMRRLIAEQDALEAQLSGRTQTPSGLLTIAAPVDFGATFVAPVAAALMRKHEALDIDLMLGSRFVNLSESGVDVAVRVGGLAASSLIAKRIGAVPRVIVGAPEYMCRRGTPRTPSELAAHDFIGYRRSTPAPSITFLGDHERRFSAPITYRTRANSVRAISALMRQGLGLTLGPAWAYHDEIASGRLVRVLPEYRLEAYPLHALYTQTSYLPAKTRAFLDAFAAHVDAQTNDVLDTRRRA
ncbi:MAG: LysR family transcriptional regulator [Myxococcota bacterium]